MYLTDEIGRQAFITLGQRTVYDWSSLITTHPDVEVELGSMVRFAVRR